MQHPRRHARRSADQCAARCPVAVFAEETQRKLKEILPRFGYAGNPTDLTGQALSNPDLFGNALRLVAADLNSEALIVQLANRGPHDAKVHAGLISEAATTKSLPTIISFLGDSERPRCAARSSRRALPARATPRMPSNI